MAEPEELKLTSKLRELLERVERQSGTLQLLQVVASDRQAESRVNALRRAGYIVKCDHPTVIDRRWNVAAEALAITDAGNAGLARLQKPRR